MKMPFGKYKDCEMDDIPASYLDWLRGQSWIDQWPLIAKYIEENSMSINSELN